MTHDSFSWILLLSVLIFAPLHRFHMLQTSLDWLILNHINFELYFRPLTSTKPTMSWSKCCHLRLGHFNSSNWSNHYLKINIEFSCEFTLVQHSWIKTWKIGNAPKSRYQAITSRTLSTNNKYICHLFITLKC